MSDQLPPMKRKRGRPARPPKICQILTYEIGGKLHMIVLYNDGRAFAWPPSPEDPEKPVEFTLTPITFKTS